MAIGIDLGTTYSVMAYVKADGRAEVIPNSEGQRVTPSSVMFDEDDSVVVGEIAKESSIVDSCSVIEYIKNEMGNCKYIFRTQGNKEYTPEEISSLILRKLKKDAEMHLGKEVHKAVITVPAYFTDAQRKATQDAGRLAGFEVLKIINEPTAAAIAFAHSKSIKNMNILVYDLGGGTFDATIVHCDGKEIEVKATDGIRKLGGHFFDQQIINLVAGKFQKDHNIDLFDDQYIEVLQELNKKAEDCKIHLTARSESYIFVNCDGIKEKIKINRNEFNDLIKTLYERTERIVLNTLRDSGMSWPEIDKILLVGGASRIPYIRTRLKELSGQEPSCEINPDESVAIGAAIQASMLDNNLHEKNVSIVDVCSHGIGLITIDSRTLSHVNTVMIQRNTQIPARCCHKFYTSDDNQEWIKLELTEGESNDIEDVNIIGSFEIDIPKGLKKGTEVEIEMLLDENQIVHLYTRITQVNDFFRELHITRNSNLDEQQIKKKKDLISKIKIDEMGSMHKKEIELPAEIAKEFESFVGMESVKKHILSFVNEANLDKKRREELNLHINNVRGYHFMLLGNPGTGKTTVARVIARILHIIGIRDSDNLIEVDKSNLVGQYIGHTEENVKNLLTQASGGTLFIDEAYTLYKKDDDKDFGGTALNVLMKAMEDQRDSFTIIFAGYKKQMYEMLEANEGLKSRINFTIEIPDYTDEELLKIADKMAEGMGFIITESGKKAISECIKRERVDEKFSNARFIRDLLNQAYRNLANRIVDGTYTKESLMKFEAIDFGVNLSRKPEEEINESLASLKSLIGLKAAKGQVESIVNSMRVRQEMINRGISTENSDLGTMHMLFRGNPGTGKTTVARIIGGIYKSLGILKRGDVFVECTRGELVGKYQGHTAEKTKEVVKKAVGGILFVDEAYSLYQGENDSFGREAIDTLIAEMENKRDRLMVILAGYKDDMDNLLEANSGLKSRINTVIDFEDYSLEELLDIFTNMIKNRGLNYSDNVLPKVKEEINKKYMEKDFGNARGIRNILETIIRNQNNRIAKELAEGKKLCTSDFTTILHQDVFVQGG